MCIAPEHIKNGRINSVLFAEELQHGIDEYYGRNDEAKKLMIQRQLTNERFHAQVFQRILDNRDRDFSFLTPHDITILQQHIRDLSK